MIKFNFKKENVAVWFWGYGIVGTIFCIILLAVSGIINYFNYYESKYDGFFLFFFIGIGFHTIIAYYGNLLKKEKTIVSILYDKLGANTFVILSVLIFFIIATIINAVCL